MNPVDTGNQPPAIVLRHAYNRQIHRKRKYVSNRRRLGALGKRRLEGLLIKFKVFLGLERIKRIPQT